jgi:predicted nucleic acid-binding protein
LTGLVIDASASLAWLLGDEINEAAVSALARVVEEGAAAPSLWRLEVANALSIAVRRGRCDEAFVDAALANLDELGVEIDAETAAHAWGQTLHLARAETLTVYDASYLELALRLGVPMVSADAELISAARRRGLGAMAI